MKRLKEPFTIIVMTFALTVIAVLIYVVAVAKSIPESDYIAIPFVFICLTGIGLFVESILFAIIYRKQFSKLWYTLVPVFLLSSFVPGWIVYNWYKNLPATVPKPGKLPVSVAEYNDDKKLVRDDYLRTSLESNGVT